ncbi:MAG: hypothetical protein ACRDF4_08550 [Rhabdochlamydiaceae bacterium]
MVIYTNEAVSPIRTSGGVIYYSPWVDAQQVCNTQGIPGCSGVTGTPSPYSPAGNTQWLYPPSADKQYQSNLTAVDDTGATNVTGQEHYLNNIQSLNAQFLPDIQLAYPDKIFAYNTAKWTGWQSSVSADPVWNISTFNALKPATGSITSTGQTTSSTGAGTTSISATGVASTVVTSTGTTMPSSSTAGTFNPGTIELIAGIVIVIIIIGGIAAYMMRRRT